MIAILDYDAGNIRSVEKAVEALGEKTVVTRDRHSILAADKVILPGVGAFGDAMARLKEYDLVDTIHEVVDKNTPFLGICLGLQLMFESSDETPGVEGLGILPGKILRIPDCEGLKIPHMGWNSLDIKPDQPCLQAFLTSHMYTLFIHIILRLLTKKMLQPQLNIQHIFMHLLLTIIYLHVSFIRRRAEVSDLRY